MSRTYSNIINRDVQKNPLNKKFQTRQYLLKNEKKYLFIIQFQCLVKNREPIVSNIIRMEYTHQVLKFSYFSINLININ